MAHYNYDDEDDYDYDGEDDIQFMQKGSALRCATENDPRIHPCPTCGESNRLTLQDKRLGYQCDSCADRAERGYD